MTIQEVLTYYDCNARQHSKFASPLPHSFFALMDFDNITLLNSILTPCFGEDKSLAKQWRHPDTDHLSAMERPQGLVEDFGAQKQRCVHLLSGKSLVAGLSETPKYDNFEVIQRS
jgi:hypothetical protein